MSPGGSLCSGGEWKVWCTLEGSTQCVSLTVSRVQAEGVVYSGKNTLLDLESVESGRGYTDQDLGVVSQHTILDTGGVEGRDV